MVAARTILHVDMDAFFASVEIRDDPSLRGKPVLVGGVGRRGVVAAASYEARRYGCRSAQPMTIALRKCPHAVVLPSRHHVYEAVSNEVFEIFETMTPLVEPLSIDEAFLDITGTERLWGTPRQAAERLRAEVLARTRLTCSVGISAVKFIAKIASGRDKPDGLTEVVPGTELEFLAPLAIGELWGVGPKTEATLRGRGILTVADLRRQSLEVLERWFGEHGRHLHELSHARDPRPVEPGRARKQVSHEDTFARDIVGTAAIRRKLLSQATRVADRLVAKRIGGRRIQIKIRDREFHTETRQCTLPEPTYEAKAIYAAACRLLEAIDVDGRSFRLTGVSVGALEPMHVDEQLDLLAQPSAPARLQSVMSQVRQRFGHGALYPADAGQTERPDSTGAHSRTKPE